MSDESDGDPINDEIERALAENPGLRERLHHWAKDDDDAEEEDHSPSPDEEDDPSSAPDEGQPTDSPG